MKIRVVFVLRSCTTDEVDTTECASVCFNGVCYTAIKICIAISVIAQIKFFVVINHTIL